MPIRTKPLTRIGLDDVQDLIDREVAENHTLEYKQSVDFSDRDSRVEFLKDVSAMANASGGTILYGVAEGEGENRGIPVGMPGLQQEPDALGTAIDNLVRDGLDERLSGVLHMAIPLGDGRHVFLVRVPASPLAPHMIVMKTTLPRFYVRANTVNAPMSMRQVKEAVMQHSTAVDRARELISQHLKILRDQAGQRTNEVSGERLDSKDQIALHVVPLYPAPGGWSLGPAVENRLLQVLPFGYDKPYTSGRYFHEGYRIEFPGVRHVLFLRGGAIEFQHYELLDRRYTSSNVGGLLRFPAYEAEQDVRRALRDCALLSNDGLLPLPVLIQLSLLDVQGSHLQGAPHHQIASSSPLAHPDVLLQPIVLTSWDQDADQQIRQMFNEMWQAWGLPQSWNYREDGTPIEYDSRSGDPIPPPQPGG